MIGKRVFDELYVHVSATSHLADAEHRQRIELALEYLPRDQEFSANVAKINLRTGRLSLLAYQDFETAPFPELLASWSFLPGPVKPPTYRYYGDSLNPPILHRKEQLVASDHPDLDRWRHVTKASEDLGLFDDLTTIGFKLNWEKLIAQKGYRLVDYEFLPLGNTIECAVDLESTGGDRGIHRHLTALSRNNLSAPVQLLIRHGLLSTGDTFFDYGCGRGDDVAGLLSIGIDASGWDPHFSPDSPITRADVVNLGFVVNVIDDPAERVEAIQRAFGLTTRVMSVGVMLYGGETPGRPFRDGFVTSRNTFQKYFTQGELRDYIEHVLQQEVLMAGPGVALVFADKEWEQRFGAARFRTSNIAGRLLARRVRVNRSERRDVGLKTSENGQLILKRTEAEFERLRPILDPLWARRLDLGREPEPDEVENIDELLSEFGSLKKASRRLLKHYDPTLLQAAAEARSNDVRLFMAVKQFSRRPAYKQLESRLQRDVKAFFGDYRTAQESGFQLLLDASDSEILLRACQQASARGLGWLADDHSLQLHTSLVERLPVVLRAYVACGLILWDSISEVQLVKIHIGSGKLSLMEFDEFDSSPIPYLKRRIKVNIKKLDYDLFEYGSPQFPRPLLYRKSRYLHEDYPGFAEQLAFDECLEETGIFDGSEFGPSAEDLTNILESTRLQIKGLKLIRSETTPNLHAKCGANFIYQDLIECGETQKRLGLKNIPQNPATYNALYDLATRVLDPIIDYFGAINLTYGFCSSELGRHIQRRVAPKLDQHASHELAKSGKPICDRGGAACDFLIDDEDMGEVAEWIIANTPFDRLYFYGSSRPLHVSYAPEGARQAFSMNATASGRLVPRRFTR
jgi:DNA phosphorothioation-associated putative methyltransferase